MTKHSRPQATAQTDAARYMPTARPPAVRDSSPATPSAAAGATVKVTNKNQRPTKLFAKAGPQMNRPGVTGSPKGTLT